MGTHRFDLNVVRYVRKQGGNMMETEAVTIVIKDLNTGESFPHPITHFLYIYYHRNSGSINSELAAAYVVVPFLNFILEKVQVGQKEFHDVKGITDLREEHANLFLKECVEKKANKASTMDKKENYLSKLYYYLWNQGILKHKPKFKLITMRRKDENVQVYKINFIYKKTDETLLREKVKRKDLVTQREESNINRHIIRLLYIREILLVAKQETPDIAFAVALEIFGGIRRGGIVNLVRTALKPQNGSRYGEEGLIVEIRDRQKILFNRFQNVSKLQVKRPRDQSFLIDPILCYLYKHHIEVVLKKVKDPKCRNALFYDANGNPMSADVFDKRFLKLKNTYLGMLLGTNGRYQDYLDFSETKWRSHIGRGVFTNMCRDAGFNEKQTAVLRGDKSTQAMESYFDIISATYNIRKALGLLSPEKANEISNLNMPFYQKRWEDVKKIESEFRV